MLHFEHPYILWLALAIPVAIMLYLYYQRWRGRKLSSFAEPHVIDRIRQGAGGSRRHIKFILQILAFGALVVAVAMPQVVTRAARKTISGGDVVICLDISNSMLAEDIRPNRLIRARQSIANLLRQLDEEQVGLVVFAGEAFIQVPLTTDKTAAVMLLNTITTKDISNQGTAIADAISLATRTFGPGTDKTGNRSVILITDGEDHEGRVIEEAMIAASQGISIYTLGVGDPNGAPIPIYNDGILTGYAKDREGNTVISSMNPKLLAEIADVSGGKFFLSANLNIAMQRIKSEIRSRGSGERLIVTRENAEHQYAWFAGFAMVILLIERMLPYRKSRRTFIDNFRSAEKE